MDLVSSLKSNFSFTTRRRGKAYYHRDAVEIIEGSSTCVVATVQGTRLYEVEIHFSGNELEVSCECPAFEDQPCKHLWATLLNAYDEGLLSRRSHAHTVMVSCDASDDDDDDLDDDDDDIDPKVGLEDLPAPLVDIARQALRSGNGETLADIIPLFGRLMGTSEASRGQRGRRGPRPSPARMPSWQQRLDLVHRSIDVQIPPKPTAEQQLLYALAVEPTRDRGNVALRMLRRPRKKDGNWGKARPRRLLGQNPPEGAAAADHHLIALIQGAAAEDSYYYGYGNASHDVYLRPEVLEAALPTLCKTGRFFACDVPGSKTDDLIPIILDDGPPFVLTLQVEADEKAKAFEVQALLTRSESESVPLAKPWLLLPAGWVLIDGKLSRLQHNGAFAWISMLRKETSFQVPFAQGNDLLRRIYKMSRAPQVKWPEQLAVDEVSVTPRPLVRVHKPDTERGRLPLSVGFRYDDRMVDHNEAGHHVFDDEAHKLYRRDAAAERRAIETLQALGCHRSTQRVVGVGRVELEIARGKLPGFVHALAAEGNFDVEADGKLIRSAASVSLKVHSGVDWFDLEGAIDFGGATATMPTLLAAIRRGDESVTLDDGSVGMLPENWLKRYAPLLRAGQRQGDVIRYEKNQVALLDVLLQEAEATSSWDKRFGQARDALRSFSGIKPQAAPKPFVGTLRPYQKQGLGWLTFLKQFGFGGCLADDMGLGKTIQALALLVAEHTRKRGDKGPKPPSLCVVPKSLLFNWEAEAKRFAPTLRVLMHTGSARAKTPEAFADFDLVVTTYGVVRRDITMLRETRFHYAILDEAQAIKNAASQSSKSARLIDAEHRLALSGTPVENHIGELFSLFSFLNPGLLGQLTSKSAQRGATDELVELLSKALRPMILRRTKAEVAKDLPKKTEQTLLLDLSKTERELYNELRDHYRRDLLSKGASADFQRNKIKVLEALLRLRQAACHPGLIDPERAQQPSAKLEALLEQLDQAVEGGHKALVFSQFTSLLAIVRQRLDAKSIVYEYLDGKTRDRASCVQRFQTDPDCPVFLISLKAGGLGLNLTAAEYVFLLDPWWNPAVEAQAIDRTHRIGQTKPVFAYRIVAQDTVEEKVLQLQDKKRKLADAIIGADARPLSQLTRKDLQHLLS